MTRSELPTTYGPEQGNWWTRPAGGWEVLRVALPLVVSMLSWTVMNFTDRMFLAWYDPVAMAAALPSGMLHFTMLCFPLGVALYANSFVAQYLGAGRHERIGLVVWQAVWLGLLATPLLLATIPFAPAMFALSGHEPDLARFEVQYYQAVTPGAGGMLLAAAFSTFYTGRGATWVVMLVDSAASLLNIALDYAWIFGHWGLPAAGIAGAAYATAVCQWARALTYWVLSSLTPSHGKYGLRPWRRPDWTLMRRLWRFGAPSGLQLLVDSSAFTVFVMLVAWLGQQAAAATTIAFSVNAVAFVPILGLGTAVATMVGHNLGANQPDLAARATWTSAVLALVYTGSIASLYVLVPRLFLLGFSEGVSPAEFEELSGVIVVLLRFVAAYSMFDALNIVFSGAIKGAGDTRFILYTTGAMSVPPLALVWTGIEWFDAGLYWCWIVVTAWASGLGLAYLARFLQGRWRTMRVIEPDVFSEDATVAAEPALAVHFGQTSVVQGSGNRPPDL